MPKNEQDTDDKPSTCRNLYQRLVAITGELSPITKDGKNREQGYDFISYAAVAGELRTLFAKHGVMVIPVMLRDKRSVEAVVTKNGRSGYHVTQDFDFQFINCDNPSDALTVPWTGEAIDYGDKAVNKAATSALKYCLMRTFNISEKGEEEADTASHGDLSRPPAPAPQPVKLTVQDYLAKMSATLQSKGIETKENRKQIILAVSGVSDSKELTAQHLIRAQEAIENSTLKQLQGYLEIDDIAPETPDSIATPVTEFQLTSIRRLVREVLQDQEMTDVDVDGWIVGEFGVFDPKFMTTEDGQRIWEDLQSRVQS